LNEEIRFYDLFGGIGGFRAGLEKANNTNRQHLPERRGSRSSSIERRDLPDSQARQERRNGGSSNSGATFKCVGYCDFDKRAVQCYNANFNEHHEPTDVKTIDPNGLPDFDLLCAGFPCQPFSLAGKRKAFDDERGNLFEEIIRIARIKKPEQLLLENVKGLLSAQRGYCFTYILSRLDELGYCVEWQVINSSCWVPQNRERVFIHCFRKGTSTQIFPLRNTIEKLVSENGRTKNQDEHRQDGLSLIYDGLNDRVKKSEVTPTLSSVNCNSVTNRTGFAILEDRRQSKEFRLKQDVNVNAHYGTGGGNVPLVLQSSSEGMRNRIHDADKPSPTLRASTTGGGNAPLVLQAVGDRDNPSFSLKEKANCLNANPMSDRGQVVLSPCLTEAQGGQGSSKEFLSACEQIAKTENPMFNPKDYEVVKDLKGIACARNKVTGETMYLFRLTPKECERLQGFKDDWTNQLPDSPRYKALGNAVTVNVIQAIGEQILAANNALLFNNQINK
jgi:DNA (cytosine-5)-methyltransferase 1